MDREGPGIWNSLACRKRYFDDRTRTALDAGIDAVVVLGAGLDTRAMRLVAPTATPSFEVDQPAVIERKTQRIDLPDNVIQFPIDFETDDLRTALETHGYDAASKTLFLWEGVTQYLTECAVRDTLAMLATAPTGSILVFSHIRQDFLDGTDLGGYAPTHRRFVGRNPLWQFGLQPNRVAGLLNEYGWDELEQVGGPEYADRYLTPLGRDATVPDLERCVTAAKR